MLELTIQNAGFASFAIRKNSCNGSQYILATVPCQGNTSQGLEGFCHAMGNPRILSGDLAREQAIIFRKIERLRIDEGFHDRLAPELLIAVFQLYQIRKDLEPRSFPESADIQKVADRISAGIREFLAVLNPPNEEVQQAESNLN